MDQKPARSADSALSRESAVSWPSDIRSSYPEGCQSPEGKIYPISCGVHDGAEAKSSHPVAIVAESFDRPSEAHTRQPVLRTNPATGQKYWDQPLRRPLYEIKLKHPECVQGLRAFANGDHVTMSLEWLSPEPIDEPMARDAQSRGGWSDTGYGFYGFRTTQLEDGQYVAVWKCGVSCE